MHFNEYQKDIAFIQLLAFKVSKVTKKQRNKETKKQMWQDHFRHDFMTEVFLQIDENFDQTKITKINAIMKEVFKCLKMFL